MKNKAKNVIDGTPAPYPSTSSAEMDSRTIFLNLIDPRFMKADIRVLDKFPNCDGIIEITTENQHPVGKVEIQLKTMKVKDYATPKFQCEKSFFSYCQFSALPVILVVVNRKDKIAYWRHIDYETLLEVNTNMTGKTYSLPIPKENCLNGKNQDYIQQWTDKAEEVVEKVWNYDSLFDQKQKIEKSLNVLRNNLHCPTQLPLNVLKNMHDYLDKYNYILDVEFPSIKQVLYPNYWKIGIGILKYDFGDIRYVLFPVEYKKAQTLIKELVLERDLHLEMLEGNILVSVFTTTNDDMRKFPLQTAYKSLADTIIKNARTYNFPIADDFIANEYLVSFIDHYWVYLDMEENKSSYSLCDIKYMLDSVLPMYEATNRTYAESVQSFRYNIDHNHSMRPSDSYRNRLKESIQKINSGYIPTVTVSIVSELYNIELVNYYILYLQDKGVNHAERKYFVNQHNKSIIGVDFKKTWNTEVLWANVKIFFAQFFALYEKYLLAHFTAIQHMLQIESPPLISIVCLLITDKSKGGPYLEIYKLRPDKPEPGKVYFFQDTDSDNPISRKNYFIDRMFSCNIGDKSYELIGMRVQTLDFMFSPSPSYALIKERLTDKVEMYFRDKNSSKITFPD